MGANIESAYKYAAFISYAHADERVAKKLHVALETYPLPKGMDKAERDKLFPVFRDVTELTAHHSLSEKIRDAVKTSRFLIVLCSPASKKSHWVNEEIKLFRKLHGEGSILAVIVEGVPDTAFPPALTADGREPLAANMATNEGFRFGVTQLAASMLGVGLDRLVQRDQRRRRIRTQLVTGVTTALAIIMGGLAWTAIDARDEAEVALGKAEVSRNEAEKMVEFMIGDLKDDLTPIQKLDLFDNIGKRVSDYYDGIPFADMDDDRLMRKARTLHLLGEVELNRGNYEKAEEILRSAYLITEDVYIRNPENTTAIFAHAQSEFWVSQVFYYQQKFEQSLPFKVSYMNLAVKLLEFDPENFDLIMEAGWGSQDVALVNMKLQNLDFSKQAFEKAEDYFRKAMNAEANGNGAAIELANNFAGMAQLYEKLDRFDDRMKYLQETVDIYKNLSELDPADLELNYLYNQSLYFLARADKNKKCSNADTSRSFYGIVQLLEHDPENFTWRKFHFMQWRDLLISCNSEEVTLLEQYSKDRFFSEADKYKADPYILKQLNYLGE